MAFSTGHFDFEHPPLLLFDARWSVDQMQKLSEDPEVLASVEGRDFNTAVDVRGIPWSTLSASSWCVDAGSEEALTRYSLTYLRFTISVREGIPGDSMLFLFNHPGTDPAEGCNAHIHVEVVGESEARPSMPPGFLGQRVELLNILTSTLRPDRIVPLHRSSKVSEHLTPGFQGSLEEIIASTQVRWFGLSVVEGLEVRVQCELLGGFF